MCGIIGTTNLTTPVEDFDSALQQIKLRGPDNTGKESNEYVLFGHTRLAILDLDQRSNQPFFYKHDRRSVLITFNGEIYNYLALKENLTKKGYSFRTNSDTEVVCAAFLEYGLNCFDHFNGMWAIALSFENKLILSRDRVGKKPLHIGKDDQGNIHFSSSLRAVSILMHAEKLDPHAIELYFALGFIPGKYSAYENIDKVLPGEVLEFTKKNGPFELTNTRNSQFLPDANLNTRSVKFLINTAVKSRLNSDVPVTTLMSGGVDSTIVTCLIRKNKPETEAYFVDFDDDKLSEHKWANYLAKRNSINLNTVNLSSDKLDLAFADYYKVYEEPFADYSGIPSIAIFREVSKKYKVVLTGDGGDELFFGYPHYFKKFILFRLFNFLKLFRNSKLLPDAVKKIVTGKREEFESNYLSNHGIITPFAKKTINEAFNYYLKQRKLFLRSAILYDRKFYNWPEKYLVKVDRSSMFSGVEVRSPFMDEQLEKRTNKTPLISLFTPYSSKLYLKLTYFRIFGIKYFSATKQGFTPPIEKIRNKFSVNDFNNLKLALSDISLDLKQSLENVTFESLQADKILFDRFLFFNEWFKNNSQP